MMGMVLDFRKTCSPPVSVDISRETLEVITSYKYLGVQMDSNLGWSEETDHVKKKVQSC